MFTDEDKYFVPDVDYLLTNQKCIEAINEIEVKKNDIIDLSFINYFVKKHSKLFKSFNYNPENYKNFNEFWKLYSFFSNLNLSVKYEDLAKEACQVFNEINSTNIEELIKWNSNYRPKLYSNICFSLWNNHFELNEIDFIEYFEEFGYKIEFENFKYSYEFTRHIFKMDKILNELQN